MGEGSLDANRTRSGPLEVSPIDVTSAWQHTLRAACRLEGIGLHTGANAAVTLHPAGPGHGIRFVRTGASVGSRTQNLTLQPPSQPGRLASSAQDVLPATIEHVIDTRFATTLGNGIWSVHTIEHLLAALSGCGIDNVLIEVDGPEVPILDGSAAPFVEAIDAAGIERQDWRRRVFRLIEPVSVGTPERGARLLPADRFSLACTIGFDHPGLQSQALELDIADFRQVVAPARTFGFAREVETMRAAGLIRGGGLENALVFGESGYLNPEGPRFEDEPVRHKLLDAVGDLALLGGRLLARYEGVRPGHALNVALVRAALSRGGWGESMDC